MGFDRDVQPTPEHMPGHYEYKCSGCGKTFIEDDLINMIEPDEESIICHKCFKEIVPDLLENKDVFKIEHDLDKELGTWVENL